ncbi:zinc finger protein ZIC 5 [Naviculisporaceae sp. PSN 640]
MASNNHFSFPGTAYHYTEGPVFPSTLFASTEDNLADASMNYIDPVLQSPLSPDLYLGHWDGHEQLLVQRYLEDDQKTAYFNADVPSKLNPNRAAAHNMRSAAGIPPVPPPSHVRFASPISSPGPSSSSDNMHSPPTDTDSHYEPFGSPAPLFQQPAAPFDPHWATTHEVQFVGMGPGDTCVNPHDINPNSQPMDCYENESNNLDLSFPQRTFSFESYTSSTSQCDMQPPTTASNTVAVLDLPVRRLSSPDAIEPVVKEEINASTNYPPPPNEPAESDTEPALPSSLKRKKSDSHDDDYKPQQPPSKKPNLNNNNNTRRQPRRGNSTTQKPQDPPQSKSQSQSPSQKKTKTTHQASSSSSPPPPATSTAKALPPPSTSSKANYPCPDPDCTQSFKDQTLLENHIKKQHTRPFICVFHFAGCGSTFASKNEWKRHVASQHLLLNYWLCDEGACGAPGAAATNGPPARSTHGKSRSGSAGRSARNHGHGQQNIDLSAGAQQNKGGGVIFNRKDLYTQHVRRMHMPPQIKKSLKQQQQQQAAAASSQSCSSSTKKSSNPTDTSTILLNTQAEWDTRLRAFQSRAIRERCKLPLMMTCPASHCDMTFHGEDSWDQRMEHVARHLEKAAQGREAPVRFGNSGGSGGDDTVGSGSGEDSCLVEWASRADVDIIRRKKKSNGGNGNGNGGWEWELNPTLKRGSAALSCATKTGTAAAAGGSQGMVMLQVNNASASSSSMGASGRRKNTKHVPAVRFAPVRVEDEDDDEDVKNEIVVTSSDDEEEEEEIIVDAPAGYQDDGLMDAEGEEEDDD